MPGLGSWSNVIRPKRISAVDEGIAPSWYWYDEYCLLGNWLHAPVVGFATTVGCANGRRMIPSVGKSLADWPAPGPLLPEPAPVMPTPVPGAAPGSEPGATTHAVAGDVDESRKTGR